MSGNMIIQTIQFVLQIIINDEENEDFDTPLHFVVGCLCATGSRTSLGTSETILHIRNSCHFLVFMLNLICKEVFYLLIIHRL